MERLRTYLNCIFKVDEKGCLFYLWAGPKRTGRGFLDKCPWCPIRNSIYILSNAGAISAVRVSDALQHEMQGAWVPHPIPVVTLEEEYRPLESGLPLSTVQRPPPREIPPSLSLPGNGFAELFPLHKRIRHQVFRIAVRFA